MLVADKVWYVTGGASGLGAATVAELVKQGGHVVCMDLDEELGEKLAKTFQTTVIFHKTDVRSEEHVVGAMRAADKAFKGKKTGGVIACAGVGMVGKTVNTDGTPASLEVFQTLVDINLVGTYNVARLIAAKIVSEYPPPGKPENLDAMDAVPDEIPGAVNEDRGVIILTASVAGAEGQIGQGAYAASKGGVLGLALPMARDLARYGIRVMVIAPGLFSTAMGNSTPPKAKAAILHSTEYPPRLGRAEEFAHLSLAIIGNPMLNGSVIRIDGATRNGKL
ncbi:uncharacterized protein L969DRAFT_86419 [Mixia osmundae IAM 14324]|uniref:3-hydroxyacyl-CoA dehydrogenase type-2 n=1 Tax=Mixia osmundae (strain CBS 9802 / IAM 14324 / JCM 22182 / KY 12970) TaxID=764103 RepID=G7E991_MIXOS|nr:uncharacterized protein L969DRAFT_86419 [Mixia osmundae IAM 14324]KEI39833.1 hypothetical protein L969DRAFT_86419 [Mixia osmundae IAM 14324]GAA99210.1 hypothetical protein E5Q_05903 [Mixia osmundae IAM 14324]